jgi:UDPglucose 6-dehydrogenase
MRKTYPEIGFIGQGFVGKNLADNFESRGFDVVRYDIEKFSRNRDRVSRCDVVFVCVPTPTVLGSFQPNILADSVAMLNRGCIVIIKSTVLPGTTDVLQDCNPDKIILYCPEFLREESAKVDTDFPERNIVGIPSSKMDDSNYGKIAMDLINGVLPTAVQNQICTAKEAEFVKHIGNAFLYTKVVFMNIMYDLVNASQKGDYCSWEMISKMVGWDSRIGNSHMKPVHKSGRGAGGNCFIKDFAAFSTFIRNHVLGIPSVELINSIEIKNQCLLIESEKDLDILQTVYGGDDEECYQENEHGA